MTDTESQDFQEFDTVKKHVDAWKDLQSSDVKAERLSGLTNEIWKVTAQKEDLEPEAVIYRKFGDGGTLIDRDRENYIIRVLAKAELSSEVYGGDNKYRVEKFQDSKPVQPLDLKEKPIRRRLARLLAELHNLKFDKLEKVPVSMKILTDKVFIRDFEEKANRDVYTDEEKKQLKEIKTLISEKEINFLKKIAPKKESNIVFSHNDLHAANILQLVKDDSFVLIDFEYSDYNFRGFDIANFFNETVIEYDQPDPPYFTINESNFPDEQELADFCKYYLFFTKYKRGDYDLNAILKHQAYRDEFLAGKDDIESFNKAVEELLEEVRICELYSHYFWCLWAVGKSHQTDLDFDYMSFAYARYEMYHKLKSGFSTKEEKSDEKKTEEPALSS